jgi:hypothetical protein
MVTLLPVLFVAFTGCGGPKTVSVSDVLGPDVRYSTDGKIQVLGVASKIGTSEERAVYHQIDYADLLAQAILRKRADLAVGSPADFRKTITKPFYEELMRTLEARGKLSPGQLEDIADRAGVGVEIVVLARIDQDQITDHEEKDFSDPNQTRTEYIRTRHMSVTMLAYGIKEQKSVVLELLSGSKTTSRIETEVESYDASADTLGFWESCMTSIASSCIEGLVNVGCRKAQGVDASGHPNAPSAMEVLAGIFIDFAAVIPE